MASPPPLGYRFRPKDDELLTFYLTNKINAHYPLPSLYPHIFDIDVYAHHPSTIFQSSESHRYGGENDNDNDGDGEMHCYIFTNLKTKESNDNYYVCNKGEKKKGSCSGKRKRRTVGNWGTWEQQFTKNVSLRGSLLGFKKYFKFVPSNVDDDNKDGKHEYEWSMYEYRLLDHPDFALCRLTKKKMNKKNNNGSAIVIQLANVYDDDDGDNRKRARVDNDGLCWDNNSALIGSPCLTNNVDVDDLLSRMDEFINDVDKGVYDELFSEPSKQDYHNNDDHLRLVIVDDDDVDKGVYDELLSQLGQVQDYNNHHLHLTLVDDNDGDLQVSSSLPDEFFSVDEADQDWDDRELQDLLNQD